eukprot:11799664-Ditylum_brightwellii.AAC.1
MSVRAVWCKTWQNLTKIGSIDVFQSTRRLDKYGERYTVLCRSVMPCSALHKHQMKGMRKDTTAEFAGL